MKKLSTLLIRAYQAFSSMREPRCKYYPSCSNYAATAIKRYGFKGLAMSIWRVVRCNPWSHGGVDYVDYHLDSSAALHTQKIKEGVH